MIFSEHQTFNLLHDATVATNATTATGYIDTRFHEVTTIVAFANAADATNADAGFTAFAIQGGDTTSSFSNIDGLIGTTNSTATSSQFVLPDNNNTSEPQAVVCAIRAPHPRYLRAVIQAADTSHDDVVCIAIGDRSQTPLYPNGVETPAASVNSAYKAV